jgi:hypothetical protein
MNPTQFDLTPAERQLALALTVLGWLAVALAVVTGISEVRRESAGFAEGLVVAETALAGIVLLLGASGLRQNRAALELAYLLFFVSGVGWLTLGLFQGSIGPALIGIAFLVVWVAMLLLRRRALRSRFSPRFLNLRQFEVVIQIADTMIQGEGAAVLSPIEIAGNVDRAMARLEAPLVKQMRRVLFIVEWLLPLYALGRPFTFSALGSHDRRLAVEKVIGKRWIVRDVARFLKVLSCIGYYGNAEGMRSVGYRPVEERPGFGNTDPRHYDDPLPLTVRG